MIFSKFTFTRSQHMDVLRGGQLNEIAGFIAKPLKKMFSLFLFQSGNKNMCRRKPQNLSTFCLNHKTKDLLKKKNSFL